MSKFYVHRNTYLRRYDHEVILGKHLDVGTALVVFDSNRKQERTVTVSKIKEVGLMEAARVLIHDGMNIEFKQITIIPATSHIAYSNKDILSFKSKNQMQVHLSSNVITELGVGRVTLHFPAMFYNFFEVEISDSNQFLISQGGIFLQSEPLD